MKQPRVASPSAVTDGESHTPWSDLDKSLMTARGPATDAAALGQGRQSVQENPG